MQNKNRHLLKFFTLILVAPLVLSGCVQIKKDGNGTSNSSAATAGGLFRSSDLGETWDRVTTIYTLGEKKMNFNAASITTIALDALDDKAIYIGTQLDGVFYSYNYGEGWFNTLHGKGIVNDIAIDPKANCTIFAAVHNTIYKSTDCSRTWKSTYFEALPGQYVTALAIDASKNNIVYAGTSGGTFVKSSDYGKSWDVLNRFDDSIKEIIIQNHSDSNILYVVNQKKGIFRSSDGGLHWEDLMQLDVDLVDIDEDTKLADAIKLRKEKLKLAETDQLPAGDLEKLLSDKYKTFGAVSGTKVSLSFSSDMSNKDAVIYANKLGIFRLKYSDGVWQQLKLLTPDKKDTIYSVVVNPQDTKEIIYGTTNAMYHSIDGGVNWKISSLPTAFAAKVLKFSLDNKFLYMGAYKLNTK